MTSASVVGFISIFLTVFLAASAALIASTAIAVSLGTVAERYLAALPLRLVAGIGFIVIGVVTVAAHFAEAKA